MGILAWIVLGLIAGALAKFIMPGRDPGGIIVTIVLGIVGALVGGFLGTLLGFGDISGFDVRSIVIAVIGASFCWLFTAQSEGKFSCRRLVRLQACTGSSQRLGPLASLLANFRCQRP